MTLTVITPGPVMTIYRDGQPVISVTLSTSEALAIISNLAKEIRT
jgi:hypothetical protein